MVLLYVLLSDIYPLAPDSIFFDVEKSLEVFQSMKTLAVARRCAEIIREALNIAQKRYRDRQRSSAEHSTSMEPGSPYDLGLLDQLLGLIPDSCSGQLEDGGTGNRDPGPSLNGLVDTNLMFNFLNFEDWDAWNWQH